MSKSKQRLYRYMIDGRLLPAKIVDELLNQATWLYPDLEKNWWQRIEN
ncbi:MAG: hypothetical protein AAF572_22985 [Cyanobacteria bacterium P01_B01_bin.77]